MNLDLLLESVKAFRETNNVDKYNELRISDLELLKRMAKALGVELKVEVTLG